MGRRQFTAEPYRTIYTPDDTETELFHANDTPVTTPAPAAWTLTHEILVNQTGLFYVTHQSRGGSATALTQIRVNEQDRGDQHSNSTSSYVKFHDVVAVGRGDVLQLWLLASGTISGNLYTKELRMYGVDSVIETAYSSEP